MQKQVRLQLADGVHLTCLQADQYKSAVLSVGFVLPLNDDAAYAALTPQVLHRGTREYPEISLLGEQLDEMYGAWMGPYIRKIGDAVIIGSIADVIDESYAAEGEQLTQRLACLLYNVWYDPYMKDNLLSAEYTQAEGANLADRIEAQKNDPRSFAMRRVLEIMCEGEPYGKNEYGSAERAKNVDAETLTRFWKQTVERAPIEIFYCGSLSAEQAAACFAPFANRSAASPMPVTEMHPARGRLRTVTEERDVTQGKLSIGFRTGLCGKDKDYPTLMLLGTVFGGYTGSRLFVNVREKRSLCYYASASVDKLKGIMVVSSGIENENFEVARDEILHQLEILQTELVPEEELAGAKRTLISSLSAMQDHPGLLEHFFLSQAAGGLDYDLEELIERLSAVTAQQVLNAAKHIVPDTVYFMKGAAK